MGYSNTNDQPNIALTILSRLRDYGSWKWSHWRSEVGAKAEQVEEANKWTAVLQSLHPRCEQRHDHRLMRASSSQYIAAGAVDLVRSEYLHVQAL